MKMDFSQVNLQYLVQARITAKRGPQLAAVLPGIHDGMTCMLFNLSVQELTRIIQIKTPLLIPRQEAWWWSRLLTCHRNGRRYEIEAM